MATESVRVRTFVKIALPAPNIAETTASIEPSSRTPMPGRKITSMPAKPINTAVHRCRPTTSRKYTTAMIVTKTGDTK